MFKSLLALGLLINTFPVPADEWRSNINLALGQKNMNDAFFDRIGAGHHSAIGVMVDFSYTGWPVALVFDRFVSNQTLQPTGGTAIFTGTSQIEMSTDEYNAGVRRIWHSSQRGRLYLDGGLARLTADYTEKQASSSQQTTGANGTGYWAGAGLYFTFARQFNLGLDVRHSVINVTLFNHTVNAGGTTTSLFLGYHW